MSRKIIIKLFIKIIALYLVCNKLNGQVNLSKVFSTRKLSGSTTIYDLKNDKWYFSNQLDANMPIQAASTFKIINTLIALQTGAIDSDSIIVYEPGYTNTLTYGYRPDIY